MVSKTVVGCALVLQMVVIVVMAWRCGSLVVGNGGACSSATKQMIDIGKALSVHQEQKLEIEQHISHGRQASSLIMESCFKHRKRSEKLVQELLQENQALRERIALGGIVQEKGNASSSS